MSVLFHKVYYCYMEYREKKNTIALELYLFAHLVPDQTSIVSDSKLGYPLLGLYIVGIARVLLVALLEERNISGLWTRKM